MEQRSLAEWLAWMEAHHPRQIELGLARIAAVADRLGLRHPRPPVITVGGTNGKGSCVAFLEAILLAQGYRVGAYTSPHLLRYNERVRIDGHAVDDAALCAAFSAIHAALGDTSLTYFEFGTLAALWLFQREPLDVLVLEVGLGGRLDAVNLIDADAAVLSTIDLDHQDWLGDDRELGAGLIDVKNFYTDTPEDVAKRIRTALKYVRPEKLWVNPDCGFGWSPRYMCNQKIGALAAGARLAREQLSR